MLHDFDKYMVHLIPKMPSPPHEMAANPHESTLRCWCKPTQDPDEPTVILHNDPN